MQSFIEEFIKICEKEGIGPWEVNDTDYGSLVILIEDDTFHFSIVGNWHELVTEREDYEFKTPQKYAQKVKELLTDKH